MKFTAFSEENWKYSIIDLYFYKLLNILTFKKIQALKKKIDHVEEYVKNLKRVY